MNIPDRFSIKLCCGGRGCPVITEISPNLYRIEDDNFESVTLTGDELVELRNVVNSLIIDGRLLDC